LKSPPLITKACLQFSTSKSVRINGIANPAVDKELQQLRSKVIEERSIWQEIKTLRDAGE
jgi:hypothetical protein